MSSGLAAARGPAELAEVDMMWHSKLPGNDNTGGLGRFTVRAPAFEAFPIRIRPKSGPKGQFPHYCRA